jgi:hypothetical protein
VRLLAPENLVRQCGRLLALTLLFWGAAAAPSSAQRSAAPGPRDMDALKTRGGLASLSSSIWVQKRDVAIDVHFATTRDLSRSDSPYNNGHIKTRETPAGEPGVAFKAGDAILTGTAKESWPIAKAKFEQTYAPAQGSRVGKDGKFFKKPTPVLGLEMDAPFAVTASWGRLEGRPGDWLVQYDDAGKDFGIVGQQIFAQTYERLAATPELRSRLEAMRARVPKH